MSPHWKLTGGKYGKKKGNEKVNCDITGTLNGQNVTVSTYSELTPQHFTLPPAVKDMPGWPKGMEPGAIVISDYGWSTDDSLPQEKGFNLTVQGPPMEDLVVTMIHEFYDQVISTNVTVSQNSWIPVVGTSGMFRADVINAGRTVFIQAGAVSQTVSSFRLTKPVSTLAISISSDRKYYDHHGPYVFWLSQGKKCSSVP